MDTHANSCRRKTFALESERVSLIGDSNRASPPSALAGSGKYAGRGGPRAANMTLRCFRFNQLAQYQY